MLVPFKLRFEIFLKFSFTWRGKELIFLSSSILILSESVNIFIFKPSALNKFLTFKFAKNFKNGFETLRFSNSNSEGDPFAKNDVLNGGIFLKYSFFEI